jgi:hypothetical protein
VQWQAVLGSESVENDQAVIRYYVASIPSRSRPLLVLVRLDHIANGIVNADQSIM